MGSKLVCRAVSVRNEEPSNVRTRAVHGSCVDTSEVPSCEVDQRMSARLMLPGSPSTETRGSLVRGLGVGSMPVPPGSSRSPLRRELLSSHAESSRSGTRTARRRACIMRNPPSRWRHRPPGATPGGGTLCTSTTAWEWQSAVPGRERAPTRRGASTSARTSDRASANPDQASAANRAASCPVSAGGTRADARGRQAAVPSRAACCPVPEVPAEAMSSAAGRSGATGARPVPEADPDQAFQVACQGAPDPGVRRLR